MMRNKRMKKEEKMRIRPYKRCDAEKIVSWIGDERHFRYWCADRFESYPISKDDLNAQYDALAENDDIFHFTAYDSDGPLGHFNIRFPDRRDIDTLRFGYVILDPEKRGRGLGRQMIELALRYAREYMKAERATIGVFEENEAALNCYLSAGFSDSGISSSFRFHDEEWACLELEYVFEEKNSHGNRE